MGAEGSGSLVEERVEALERCCCCCCCFCLFLETDEGFFDFLFLVLLGLTGKNMADSGLVREIVAARGGSLWQKAGAAGSSGASLVCAWDLDETGVFSLKYRHRGKE